MSAGNVASSSVVPVALASGATAGVAGGATSLAVHVFPTTGAGLTLLLVSIAITFVLAGAVLLWNPLNRHHGHLGMDANSPAPGPDATIAHNGISD